MMTSTKIDKAERKAICKEGKPIGLSLILYILITTVAAVAILLPGLLITGELGQLPEIAQFVAPILGLGFMFLYFRSKMEYKTLFKKEKKMTALHFIRILFMFIGISTVAQFFYQAFEESLQQMGYSFVPDVLEALLGSNNVFMLLAVWIIAPIGEELIFRGFLLRHLEKHGKVAAIFITSLLFGLFHGNLGQGMNAFAVGLVLGYVAMEYSVIWSIVLHWINNFVFCSLLPGLLGGIPAMAPISALVALICLAIAVYMLVYNRRLVADWFKENAAQENRIEWLLSSGWMNLFLMLHTVMIVLCIHSL